MKILVIGDFIQDVYTFGTAVRLCPEAPVPVLIPQITRESLGGGGLVWAQLIELSNLRHELDIKFFAGSYSTKRRFFAGSHLICRVDEDSTKPCTVPTQEQIGGVDAFVIADYGKGAMTRALAHQIVQTDLPCFVDAKHHWHWYSGRNVTIFPNEHECLDETFMDCQVVRKLGKNGCEHFNVHLPASVSEVVDVTGAGDIFMAGFVFAWSLDFKPESCLRFANAIAGESCRHVGTYVVPRAFAQAYLDRLRVSEGSGQPAPDLTTYSNSPEHLRSQQQYPPSFSAPSVAEAGDSLLGDCMSAAIAGLNLPGSPPRVQTHQKSTSGPTESSGVLLPDDPRWNDLDKKLVSGLKGQNPSESGNLYERTLAQDLTKIPEQS